MPSSHHNNSQSQLGYAPCLEKTSQTFAIVT